MDDDDAFRGRKPCFSSSSSSPCTVERKGLSVEQVRRIDENFRAAKAILARKRPFSKVEDAAKNVRIIAAGSCDKECAVVETPSSKCIKKSYKTSKGHSPKLSKEASHQQMLSKPHQTPVFEDENCVSRLREQCFWSDQVFNEFDSKTLEEFDRVCGHRAPLAELPLDRNNQSLVFKSQENASKMVRGTRSPISTNGYGDNSLTLSESGFVRGGGKASNATHLSPSLADDFPANNDSLSSIESEICRSLDGNLEAMAIKDLDLAFPWNDVSPSQLASLCSGEQCLYACTENITPKDKSGNYSVVEVVDHLQTSNKTLSSINSGIPINIESKCETSSLNNLDLSHPLDNISSSLQPLNESIEDGHVASSLHSTDHMHSRNLDGNLEAMAIKDLDLAFPWNDVSPSQLTSLCSGEQCLYACTENITPKDKSGNYSVVEVVDHLQTSNKTLSSINSGIPINNESNCETSSLNNLDLSHPLDNISSSLQPLNESIEDGHVASSLHSTDHMHSTLVQSGLFNLSMSSVEPPMPAYIENLNETQREAALSDTSKPLLILAGPGSGKTSTMVARLLTLLKEGVPPQNILAMTFTIAAAAEMKERVAVLAGKIVSSELTVCTFHSFCLQLCRSHAEKIQRTPEFLVYGHGQQRKAVIEATRLGLSEFETDKEATLSEPEGGDKATPEKCGTTHTNYNPASWRERARKWQHFMTQAKSAGKTPEEFEETGNRVGAAILRHYHAILAACDALDYHDFITCAVKLLQSNPEVRKECAEKWTCMLVDEFQDTSTMQYQLLRILASHNRVTVVGDDDQSIFSFNGADASGFDSFRKDFPSLREVRLQQNYRSTRVIVEAASSLIRNNLKRCQAKQSFTDNASGDKIVVRECRNEEAQCGYIIDSILMNQASSTNAERTFASFAILYRRRVTGKVFQASLRARKIPFNVHGVAFYRKKAVKNILAMLWTALVGGKDSSCRRVFKALYAGNKEEIKKVVEYIEKVAISSKSNFLEVARNIFSAKVSGTFNRRQLAQGRRVLASIDTVYRLARKEHSLSALVMAVLNLMPQGIGMQYHLVHAMHEEVDDLTLYERPSLEKRAVLNEDGSKFLNEDEDNRTVLDYFLDDVTNFLSNHLTAAISKHIKLQDSSEEGCLSVLKAFLDHIASRENENFKSRKKENENSVTLTTMHQSKGLEWDIVYIVKANDSEIPLLHESMGSVDEGGLSLEEERRLFYVAMTRARKKLHIVYVTLDTNRQLLRPSRFLRELPPNLLETQASASVSIGPYMPSVFHDEKFQGVSCSRLNLGSLSEIALEPTKYGKEERLRSKDLDGVLGEEEGNMDAMYLEKDSHPFCNSGDGTIFLKGFDIEARSTIASLFHTWAKKVAFQEPKRLLDKVSFVIEERLRNKNSKNKSVLYAVKCCLKDEAALMYAEHIIKWEQMPSEEKSVLTAEKQEHFQQQRVERSMRTAPPTPKQISYLQNLGCTIVPTSRLHASQLIEQYKAL